MHQNSIGISVLGSTGSIGTQTLEVAAELHDRIRVRALAAGSNTNLLARQITAFRPELVSVKGEQEEKALRATLGSLGYAEPLKIVSGREGLVAAATLGGCDTVVNALVGYIGLEPTIAAIRRRIDIALANKETLVVAGHIVMSEARSSGVGIYPIDSEHSAVAQCLAGQPLGNVSRVILTASGGPFRTWPYDKLASATPSQALRHPNWSMGAKITIDSATLMNKGFEVIEAKWLYGLAPDQIDVLVHPESIVHSMVEFVDGSTMAQLGPADMRIPIQYALLKGERTAASRSRLDLARLGRLTFEEPDLDRFPCLRIGQEVARQGGTMGAVVNAANEVAVARFLSGEVGFLDIPRIIIRCVEEHDFDPSPDLEAISSVDRWARRLASES